MSEPDRSRRRLRSLLKPWQKGLRFVGLTLAAFVLANTAYLLLNRLAVWGGVLREDGRYGQAAQAYRRVLEDFPGDRAAWRELGRTLYLDRRYDEALEALDEVLAIDPEDRIAHYHRMLTLRALGRESEARLAEAAFEHYRIDESAQEMTRAFRQENPGVNLMAQPIHTHVLVSAARGAGASAPSEARRSGGNRDGS